MLRICIVQMKLVKDAMIPLYCQLRRRASLLPSQRLPQVDCPPPLPPSLLGRLKRLRPGPHHPNPSRARDVSNLSPVEVHGLGPNERRGGGLSEDPARRAPPLQRAGELCNPNLIFHAKHIVLKPHKTNVKPTNGPTTLQKGGGRWLYASNERCTYSYERKGGRPYSSEERRCWAYQMARRGR